jgi:hypothetical protein
MNLRQWLRTPAQLAVLGLLLSVASPAARAEDLGATEVLDPALLNCLERDECRYVDENGLEDSALELETGPAQPAPAVFGQNTFRDLWTSYPNGEPEQVKQLIGGAVDADWIVNTCTIRISRALNYANAPITPMQGLNTLRGADGKRYAYRVAEFTRYMLRKYGKPSIKAELKPGEPVSKLINAVKGHRGLIIFVVKGWSDATGHADLWYKTTPKHAEYFDKASSVYLWE